MKNKVLIASVITIGVVAGNYFSFSGQSDLKWNIVDIR